MRLQGPFDQVIVATGALSCVDSGPEKSLQALTEHGLAAQFAVNAAGPMLVLKNVLALLPRDTGRFFDSAGKEVDW